MIDLENYPILMKHKTTLKETSKSTHNGVETFMTESLQEVINFDKVKDEYASILGLRELPKSNDALFIGSGNTDTFIEFKNGYIENQKHEIRKKIYDSIFILSDIIDASISYTKEHLNYILVYNEEKNTDPKTMYQKSQSRDELTNKLFALANERLIKGGVEVFQDYCFKNVYSYTENEFRDKFLNEL